jgi:hypothetical protein
MQMIKRIINLDVFHFHFEAELNNYRYDSLTKDHKLRCGDHINLTEMTSKIHNAGITVMKDDSDYL